MSTFLLTAFEIEMTIERLAQQRERELADDDVMASLEERRSTLEKPEDADVNALLGSLCTDDAVPPVCVMNNGIKTWQEVLRNYRLAKDDQTTLLEAAIRMYHGVRLVYDDVAHAMDESDGVTKPMGEAYKDFRIDMERHEDSTEFLSKGLAELKNTERWALLASITGLGLDPKTLVTGGNFLLTAGIGLNIKNAGRMLSDLGLVIKLLLIAFKGVGFGINELNTLPNMVQVYARVVDWVINQARRNNCAGNLETYVIGDDFCFVQDQLKDITETSTRLLMNLCDQVSGIPSVDMLCDTKVGDIFGDEGMNFFDFLNDDTKIVTFSGGGAETSLEMTLEQTRTLGQSASYATASDSTYEDKDTFCLDLFRRIRDRRRLGASLWENITAVPTHRRRLESDSKSDNENPCSPGRRRSLFANTFAQVQSETGSIGVRLGRDQSRDSGHEHTVKIDLGDGDSYDFFAVKIAEDHAYGTPIFQTMGGFSSCPGETATSKGDSMVSILKISYDYCEAAEKPRCRGLKYGTVATIGVVVQNISPWGFLDDVGRNTQVYRLFIGTRSEPWYDGVYNKTAKKDTRCGDPGYGGGLIIRQKGGLVLHEPGIFLNLPYGQTEILLDVEMDTRRLPELQCFTYNNIFVRLVSDCEYNTDAYQYRTRPKDDDDDPQQQANDDDEGRADAEKEIEIAYHEWEDPFIAATDDETSPDVGRWKPGTDAHFPLRGIGDAVSDAVFEVSWEPPAAVLDTVVVTESRPPMALVAVLSAVLSAIVSVVVTAWALRPPQRSRRGVPRYSAIGVSEPVNTERHRLLPSKRLEVVSESIVC